MRCLLMIGVLTIAVPDRPDPTPKETAPDKQSLQGEWKVVQALASGRPHPTLKPGEAVFVFKDDEMIIRWAGRQEIYSFTYDPSKKPAVFDFALGRPGKKGLHNLGIVKIE